MKKFLNQNLLFLSLLGFVFYSLNAFAVDSENLDKNMKKHLKDSQEIQDQLNSTAKSTTGYFTIQNMVIIKTGETAQLIESKNSLKTKWKKLEGKVEKTSKNYFVDYSGKEATITGPHMMQIDLLKAEGKKLQLDNGFVARVSLMHNGDLKVWLHNPELTSFKKFKKIDFFPFSEKGVIKAQFERRENPEKVDFKDSRGEDGIMYIMGLVRFTLDGKEYSFKAYSYEDSWNTLKHMMFFIKDLTSGKTTYGGGRVVEFDYDKELEDSSSIEINFNRAYAFLCAHSKFYNCPLVLTDKIQSKLEFGEKLSCK